MVIKRNYWYKNSKVSTALFLMCTPGSIQAKILQEVEARSTREDVGQRVQKWGETHCTLRCANPTYGMGSHVGDKTVSNVRHKKVWTQKEKSGMQHYLQIL